MWRKKFCSCRKARISAVHLHWTKCRSVHVWFSESALKFRTCSSDAMTPIARRKEPLCESSEHNVETWDRKTHTQACRKRYPPKYVLTTRHRILDNHWKHQWNSAGWPNFLPNISTACSLPCWNQLQWFEWWETVPWFLSQSRPILRFPLEADTVLCNQRTQTRKRTKQAQILSKLSATKLVNKSMTRPPQAFVWDAIRYSP